MYADFLIGGITAVSFTDLSGNRHAVFLKNFNPAKPENLKIPQSKPTLCGIRFSNFELSTCLLDIYTQKT